MTDEIIRGKLGRKHELSEFLQSQALRSFTHPMDELVLLDLARLLANEDIATVKELKERLK